MSGAVAGACAGAWLLLNRLNEERQEEIKKLSKREVVERYIVSEWEIQDALEELKKEGLIE